VAVKWYQKQNLNADEVEDICVDEPSSTEPSAKTQLQSGCQSQIDESKIEVEFFPNYWMKIQWQGN
jgi:hypothetical protein